MAITVKSKSPKVIGVADTAQTPHVPEKAVQLTAPKLKSTQGKAVVSKQNSDGTEEFQQENVGGPVTTNGAPAMVTMSMGLTRNLGNYESLKFNVELTLPCQPEADEIEATYQSAKSWVDDKVNTINSEISAELGK